MGAGAFGLLRERWRASSGPAPRALPKTLTSKTLPRDERRSDPEHGRATHRPLSSPRDRRRDAQVPVLRGPDCPRITAAGSMKAGARRPSVRFGALLARRVTQELVRAVEDAIGLLDGRLNLFDLPARLFAQPLGLLDKLPPTRNGCAVSFRSGASGNGSLALSCIAPPDLCRG